MKKLLFFLLIIMLSSFAFGDYANSGSYIDFVIDTNIIPQDKLYMDSDVIAVDSTDLTFEKDFQFEEETFCIQTELIDTSISVDKNDVLSYNKIGNKVTIETLNETIVGTFEEETELVYKVIIKEEVCANYDTRQKLVKTVLANLEFSNCEEGNWYRIYKVPYYSESKSLIMKFGERYTDVQCSNNKLRFEIDSFSSYTADDISGVEAGLLSYWSFNSSADDYFGINNGTVTGATNVAGYIGNAYSFDGTSDYITLQSVPVSGTNARSYSLIIKTDDVLNYRKAFATGANSVGQKFSLYIDNTGKLNVDGGSNIQRADDWTLSTGTWYNVIVTFPTSGAIGDVKIYLNGTESTTYTTSGSSSLNTATTYKVIGIRYDAGAQHWDGMIDEVYVWNRQLNDSEVLLMSTIQEEGYTLFDYPTNVSNTAPTGHSINTPTNNQNFYNYFNTSVPVTWSNATDTEGDPIYYQVYEDGVKLTNTTGNSYSIDLTTKDFDNYSLIIEACDDSFLCSNSSAVTYEYQEVNYTSIYSVDTDYENITINSVNYAPIIDFTFNSSFNNQKYALVNVIESYKSTGAVANDLYIQIELDGNLVTEDLISRLSTIGDFKVGQNIPFILVEDVGEHNLVISARRTGTGNVVISQFQQSFFQLISSDLEAIYTNNDSNNYVFDNTTYSELDNFISIFEEKQNIMSIARLSITATGPTTVFCRLKDNDLGLFSPEIVRRIKSSSDTGIASFSSPSLNLDYTLNTSLYCYNTAGETVTMDVDYIDIGLIDNASSVIPFEIGFNTSSSSTVPLNLTAGMHTIASFEHTVKDGDYLFLSVMTSMGSNSGSQTPRLYVTSNSTSCNASVQRYLADSNDIASMFIYHNCDGLTQGQTYSFNLNVEVATGEEVVIYDEYFTGIETTLLNITQQNVAPFPNEILTPANNSAYDNRTSSITVTWDEAFDINGDSVYYQIYLNGSKQTNTTNLNYSLSLTPLSFGSYGLILESCDVFYACVNSSTVVFTYTEYVPPVVGIGLSWEELNATMEYFADQVVGANVMDDIWMMLIVLGLFAVAIAIFIKE